METHIPLSLAVLEYLDRKEETKEIDEFIQDFIYN